MSASVCKSMLKSTMLLKFIKITSKGRGICRQMPDLVKNIKNFEVQGSYGKSKKFGIFWAEYYNL